MEQISRQRAATVRERSAFADSRSRLRLPFPHGRGSLHAGLAIVALCLFGCRGATVATSVTKSLASESGAISEDTQIDFWHSLADRPLTSNDDALHGLLLYIDSKDESTDYAGRVASLKSRGYLPRGFEEPADRAVGRGTLAYAATKALHVKGGAMQHLAPSPRYALREMVYLGVFPPSSTNQTFTGAEYVGVIGKMEDYDRGNGDVPRE